jgi:uncharacterized protein (TIGR00730 family)
MRICVFAGASPGNDPAHVEAARALGAEIARRGLGMVYGGASVGLMGACADAARAGGAEVIGVLPRALVSREIAHRGLADLRIVETLHERKALMGELSDAYAVLPGGTGTLDELFEVTTWRQLGVHRKPIGILDVCSYWAPLFALVEHMVAQGFARDVPILRSTTAPALLEQLCAGF